MSDKTTITGGVDNGRRGFAVFTFYQGDVGIRDRGDMIEVAFFSPPVRPTLPAQGELDGRPVMVVGVTTRDFDPSKPSKPRNDGPRAVVATVRPLS